MRAMEEKILTEGVVLPGDVLKVGSFLNQQMDVPFLTEVGREVASLFGGAGVTKVLTIEASGIAFAFAVAQALGVNMAVIKKNSTSNVSGSVYTAHIYSYTHGKEYTAVLSRDYMNAGEKVLLVDDFLACGNAFRGMLEMVRDAGAECVGAVAAVEKGYQGGGDALRSEGIRVESMAIVDSMHDGCITFRQQ